MDDIANKKLVKQVQADDSKARDILILQHKNLITAFAATFCKRPLDWNNDDELTVSLIAFNEAIDSFNEDKGLSFINYAKMVIHRRLVDYFRQEARFQHIPLSSMDETNYDAYVVRESWTNYQKEKEAEDQEEMVRLYDQALSKFGLTLDDLLIASPKHKDTKLSLMTAAEELAANLTLVAQLYRTKQLPVKELTELTGKSRKVIETGRKYIIALTIILTQEEFYSMRTLINFPGKEVGGPID